MGGVSYELVVPEPGGLLTAPGHTTEREEGALGHSTGIEVEGACCRENNKIRMMIFFMTMATVTVVFRVLVQYGKTCFRRQNVQHKNFANWQFW